MPKYSYKTMTSAGKTKTGTLTAENKALAERRLKSKGHRVLKLKVLVENSSAAMDKELGETEIIGSYIVKDANGDIQISLGGDKPGIKDLIIFTKQLATMLDSAVPLIQSLGILAKQQQSRTFRRQVMQIRSVVEGGATLSEAMENHPETFDKLYVAMVRAGEASGSLDSILLKLVSYIERRQKTASQIKSAMTYPTLVLGIAVSIITGLLVFVVPTFASQFESAGQELPALTQWVINLSNALIDNWYFFAGGMVFGFMFLKMYIKTESGGRIFDSLIIRMPVIGIVVKKIAVSRFCSTMSSMLSAGVNLLEALNICATSAGNKEVEEFVLNVRSELSKGSNLTDPIKKGGLFPEMVVSMVSVGEMSGSLDTMLEKVTVFYEEEVDNAIANMLSLIEPIMIVFIGGIIAILVGAMYLPIFDLAGTAGN